MLTVSCFEIYNEKIFDFLSMTQAMKEVRAKRSGEVYILEVKVDTEREVRYYFGRFGKSWSQGIAITCQTNS